ncbi:MAG: YqgE/AlgH family protein [Nocardioidaceae bacterium]
MSESTEPSAESFETESLRGRLLLALPALADGPFRRSVVLVLDHDADGALGVILNQPLDADVDDVLPEWGGVVTDPHALFQGGPVATDSALAVGLLSAGAGDSPIGWRSMFGRVGLVDLDVPVETLEGAIAGLRVFAGYAGWSPGQVEAEIDEGSWLVVDGDEQDLVAANPWDLWRTVLRRQRGDAAMLATFPDDPGMN